MLIDNKNSREVDALLKALGDLHLFAGISYQEIRNLEGRMLTIIDACTTDVKQRESIKSLVRKEIWFGWAGMLEFRGDPELPTGMSSLED